MKHTRILAIAFSLALTTLSFAGGPTFNYSLGDMTGQIGTAGYDPMTGDVTGGGSVSAAFLIEDLAGGQLVQGYSAGASNDPARLTPTALNQSAILADLNGGDGADFFTVNLFPDGWNVGVVNALLGGQDVTITGATEFMTIDYDVLGGNDPALVGDMDGAQSLINFNDGVGMPPVENVVVVAGNGLSVSFTDGFLQLNPVIVTQFNRGDCNDDGLVNIADGIFLIQEALAPMTPNPLACTFACDADDDDAITINDPIFIFNYRFLDGPAPAAPFGSCGVDNAPDDQTPDDCTAFNSCP